MNITTASFDNKKKELAARCEMGDITAMMELSKLFMHKTSEICRSLAKDYGGGEKQKNVLRNYLKEHPEENNNVMAANMWVTRAALYGHREAKRLYVENPVYEECSLMPTEMFISGRNLSLTYECKTLIYAGLSGFPANKNVKLDSLENGVYMAAADAGSEGPDETGFGREELYNFYQFDEFFHLLHCLKGWSNRDLRIQKVSPFAGKKEAAAEKRRRYWLINNGKNGAVQYADKPFGGDDFLIRNGVLTKCLKNDIICAEIPYGVTKIGDLAFYSCSTLEKVIIPNSVTEIGKGAFFKCSGLKSVKLPDSVNKIGEKAFLGCRNLVSIHLPDGLEHIPAHMLSLCHSLKDVNIPDSVTVIDYQSFSWGGIEKLKLPKNLKQLGCGACEHSNLTEITIPQSVETMGTGVFSNCSNLEKAVLPDSLKVLPQKTFYGCRSLQEVQLPSKLVSIEAACFRGCKKLTLLSFSKNSGKNINISPETLKKIYGVVF